jgi:hypothetical protein
LRVPRRSFWRTRLGDSSVLWFRCKGSVCVPSLGDTGRLYSDWTNSSHSSRETSEKAETISGSSVPTPAAPVALLVTMPAPPLWSRILGSGQRIHPPSARTPWVLPASTTSSCLPTAHATFVTHLLNYLRPRGGDTGAGWRCCRHRLRVGQRRLRQRDCTSPSSLLLPKQTSEKALPRTSGNRSCLSERTRSLRPRSSPPLGSVLRRPCGCRPRRNRSRRSYRV